MHYEYFIHKIKALHTREGYQLAENYEQYIHDQAKKGWRFIQLVDLTALNAKDPHIELVFERKKGGN